MNSDHASAEELSIANPYHNVYWFARMLINTDKYGGVVGKDSVLMEQIAEELRVIVDSVHITEAERVNYCGAALLNQLESRVKRATAIRERTMQLAADILVRFNSLEDVIAFILTLEYVLIPLYKAIQEAPNDDKVYAEATAKQILETQGQAGVALVISSWDDLGVTGCLNAERALVVRAFSRLRERLSDLSAVNSDVILTAFVQEFERRLGQKRKTRAGGSLEDVTSFLFTYFRITATHAPEHFQADIEVDKWVKGKDGWLIGISCKRTLRERWKQVSSADREALSRYKIRELWNLVTYDEDLSEDKIVTLGANRHRFYLSDKSRKYLEFSSHQGMKEYVRPLSSFISDLKRTQSAD